MAARVAAHRERKYHASIMPSSGLCARRNRLTMPVSNVGIAIDRLIKCIITKLMKQAWHNK